MTPADLQTLLTNVEAELEGVAGFAGVLDPALLPFIAIGKAVAKQIPGLVAGVDNWIQGNPPTQAEKDDLAQKISILTDPNAP